MFTDDETLARPREVGTLIHRAIADLARTSLEPDGAAILRAADRSRVMFDKVEARAHRQNIAGGVLSYFRHLLPPPGWQFAGHEVHLGLGRVDLVWNHDDGRVLVDEVKTARFLRRTAITSQVRIYLDCARTTWPDRFIGLRLVSTADHRASLFFPPSGEAVSLHNTHYVRS